MPKYLKTKGSCRICGDEVPLKRLRDAEIALCPECLDSQGRFRRAKWKAEEGVRRRQGAPAVDMDDVVPAELAEYLHAAGCMLIAAAHACDALKVPRGLTPADLRKWVRWARGHAEWSQGMVGNILPYLSAAMDNITSSFKLVPGEPSPGESAAPREPPTLVLLCTKENT